MVEEVVGVMPAAAAVATVVFVIVVQDLRWPPSLVPSAVAAHHLHSRLD